MVQNDHAQNYFPSIKALQLTFYKDHTVIQRGSCWVNGQRRLLPVTLHSGSLKIHQSSLFSVVDTSFSLHVKYDWFHYILVSLPKSRSDVCGNNNGNKDDDFRIPEDANAVDEAAFGWSWRRVSPAMRTVEDPAPTWIYSTTRKVPGRLGFSRSKTLSVDAMMWWTLGSNVISKGKNQEVLCQALQAYTAVCQSSQVPIKPWRSSTFCHKHSGM